jgi:ribosomal protein S18 acetylase RimI-like enzyme
LDERKIMSKLIDIRRLQISEVDDFRTIRLEALKREPEAFGAVHAIEAARPLADFAERLASSVVLGAYSDGYVVGLIGFKQEDGPKKSHKGFVWGFYVRPEMRRQGVGSALIAALIEAAHVAVEQLTLTVVQENKAAISLYERFGFSIYGVEPRAMKSASGYLDEALMALSLSRA